ncbi:MAG: chromosome segregation protein SMC, partial [Lachnospiraceae bacterium]|nr:chromosome segregation protein SMC [Lachnospiraceae bacterium]
AIVGPNGSGKSNIGDAVRWVLGEQSAKQLRGTRMEDIIFSGTELRKPLGFAYVALTLDNSDHSIPIEYEEVTVARRVYRSGESEYLINGSQCRLRDVQELFFDTGIGKEGYSIIGQGQVDQILSSKPEDRRELFDEAAGISKYKKRKFQAERNLEREQESLARINDILSELERQIGPLKRQSETAKQYLIYRDELKEVEVNLFISQYDEEEAALARTRENLGIATEQLEASKKDYEAIRAEYEETSRRVEELEGKLSEQRDSLEQTRILQERIRGQIRVLKEQIAGSEQSETHLKDRIESLHQEQETRLRQAEEARESIGTMEAELAAAREAARASLEAMQSVQEKVEAYTILKDQGYDQVLAIVSGDSDNKAALEKSNTLLEQNRLRRQELLDKISDREQTMKRLGEEARKQEQEVAALKSRLARYEMSNETAEEERVEIEKTLDEKRPALRSGQEELQRQMLRLEQVRNLAERYEGYGGAIRQVMSRKGQVKGILGVVADVIEVEKAYETAIEVALGGSIQNVVTETETAARELIEYLKKNHYGRATFLPLDSVKGSGGFPKKEALREPGVVGTAAELVKAEPKYAKLVDHLLGRILVADTMEHALEIARKYRFTLRIVTLEGEVLSPGGAITGGAYKNSSNLLARGRELDEIKKNISRLKKETQKIGDEINSLKEERKVRFEILEENSQASQELTTRIRVAQTELEQREAQVDHHRRMMEETRREYAVLEEEHEALLEEIRSLESEKEEREQLNQTENEKIEAINRRLAELREQLTSCTEAHNEREKDVIAREHTLNYTRESVTRLQDEAQHFLEEAEMLASTIEENARLKTEREAQLAQMNVQEEESETEKASLEAKVEDLSARKNTIAARQKDFFEKREALAEQMNALDKEVFRLTNMEEKSQAALQGFSDHMWEAYELTYNRALTLVTETDMSQPQMKKRVGELRKSIHDLGSINIDAIQDYQDVSERYETMNVQRNDLVEAEEKLRAIIRELDDQMRSIFSVKFADINRSFNEVFRELFGGGDAKLELQEEEDILTAGIVITAQPPGKRLQNLRMLSGGEKALTAIALLFAILNLKPSPFCLLDEIEAALDDNNVTRFADYLKKLSETTQFIVITHRRGTMTAADVLYGITMQEKGVSTMVSVNMIDDQLTQ